MKDDYTTNFHCITYTFLLKGWKNVLFELGSERVKTELKKVRLTISGSDVVTRESPVRLKIRLR